MADSTYLILKNTHLTTTNGTFRYFDVRLVQTKLLSQGKMEEK